ncbi:hypothetical protein [Natronobiforma cellulositropha]|uniref:hypothetical protein n=1 Tax=Natronobiforma cellulositropha TaxID=1679076 RepID=UPI0021D5B21D|nr:hypothetical protein [Natronobiforma cellulositropha]
MTGLDAVAAGVALVLAVGLGIVVHELAHAAVLRLARIEYTLEFVPDPAAAGQAGFSAHLRRPLAVVTPNPTGDEPAWVLRVAALMPLSLTLPVCLLAATGGLTPATPLAVNAAVIGWLACAIPSPRDFAVAFYAHQALADADEPADTLERDAPAEDAPITSPTTSRAD